MIVASSCGTAWLEGDCRQFLSDWLVSVGCCQFLSDWLVGVGCRQFLSDLTGKGPRVQRSHSNGTYVHRSLCRDTSVTSMAALVTVIALVTRSAVKLDLQKGGYEGR